MAFDENLIDLAVARFRRERDRYVKLADRVAQICREDICDANAIRAQVTGRVKSEKSLEGKLRRFHAAGEKSFSDVDDIFHQISDLAGVRIAAYQHEDCARIVAALQGKFELVGAPDAKDKNRNDPANYYRATHVQVKLSDKDLEIRLYDNLGDISCEVQVCTMMAHVWNEIEHDIGYKKDGDPSKDECHYLEQLGRTVRQGDLEISSLLKALDHRRAQGETQPFHDVHDFIARSRGLLGGKMTDISRESEQVFDMLRDLGITRAAELKTRSRAVIRTRWCTPFGTSTRILSKAGIG
ncbi:GTP pyrophosphokinase [Phaeovulum vinaykumarii]|uniref:RelA/SpoT domain-containing protein n=1 Tax=Phaeovulum vinaykumarii TaxID=407234 RepID=A0A1N7LJH6_9RHOB|nr:hypothetical protein [Phaeovulum vinaykumarii]SIS73949.1 hypothetical protein SAMN05421795_103123 [Phaeovulum vinaykumarii]SOC04831.1 RelA/SpoT family protein [Phaeovulum vinaykumarii]